MKENVTAKHEQRAESTGAERVQDIAPAALFSASMRWIEDYFTAQIEAAEMVGVAAAQWLGRIETEANLAEELASHLAAASSFGEAVTAVHDWASHRLTLMTDDCKHLVADMRRFADAQRRLGPAGWMPATEAHA